MEKKYKSKKDESKAKKKTTYYKIGIIFSFIALFLLIVNAAVGLGIKQEIAKSYPSIIPTLIFLCIFWLFLGFILILAIVASIYKSNKWYHFLILAFLALFSFRIETSILLFAASFLFWKDFKIRHRLK